MIAYIKNNEIKFVSAVRVDNNFVKDVESYEVIEYDNNITNPILQDWQIIESPNIEEITPIEIGNKIEEEVFGGNRHAQLTDLAKSQLKTIAVLVPIIWKEKVKEIYKDEIKVAREVSDVRVENGLEAFDLSFLD